MSIGILKLGGRLTWDAVDKTGGLGEAKAICELLAKHRKLYIYTKINNKDNLNPKHNINIWDINTVHDSLDDHDILIIFNGHVNFYGGAENPEQIKIYELINKFKGKIFYILIDPNLYLKQIWNSVEKKEWGSKYSKEDIFITRNDINIITSIYNREAGVMLWSKGKIPFKTYNYFSFEKYPMIFAMLQPTSNLKYDILYMGTFRNGKRQDKMIKYYFGHKYINSIFIGKTKLKDFTKKYSELIPEFLPPVQFKDIGTEVNQSIAHVCIGDKFYEGNILTPRIYECINFNTICFIDSDLDKNRYIFGDNDYFYVSSREEVEEKVLELKNNIDFRLEMLQKQRELINFDIDNYSQRLYNILIGAKI